MVTGAGRRQFLKFLGAGLTGACAGGLGPLAAAGAPPPPFLPFGPIRPSTHDDLVLPDGFSYERLAQWGDRLPGTNSRFGYNADFTAFLPMPDAREGLLFVNHEYVSLPDAGEYGAGLRFTWMRWKAGGPNDPAQGGHVFAAPDNLSFDPAGHLWVVSDITSSRLNAHAGYAAFANNGMFFVPASGPDAGVALQFASAPCEAELSGPSWTADRNTLFLSVQHPGEASGMRSAAMTPPRGSNWPGGRVDQPPRPAVVSIRAR